MIDARPTVLTVTQLNNYVKRLLDGDYSLNCVFMVGEISNFNNHYRTGHMYFTLKDENSAIKAVMFKSNAQRLRFMPEDGMSVIVRGRVSLFEAAGAYQIYIDDMQPDGVGALTLQFEQLKRKLAEEGLFDASHKKSLPPFPEKVGIITSPTGAAVQDIKNILSRRFPCAEAILYPVSVQGENSENQLVNAVNYFSNTGPVDVVIIGRGGGSIEDLWSFNSEKLARAIYDCKVPIISAVGHETDFTISDFVADRRAETPSAAAEMAVPDMAELKKQLNSMSYEIMSIVRNMISESRESLNVIKNNNCLKDPFNTINIKRMMLDDTEIKLNSFAKTEIQKYRHGFSSTVAKLNALSPLNVLARGYSVAYSNGKIVSSSDNLTVGDSLNIDFYNGSAVCEIKELK